MADILQLSNKRVKVMTIESILEEHVGALESTLAPINSLMRDVESQLEGHDSELVASAGNYCRQNSVFVLQNIRWHLCMRIFKTIGLHQDIEASLAAPESACATN